MSSRSKEEGARISRVEEYLVTIIGIKEAIVACRTPILPTFFISDDELRKTTPKNLIIIIQDLFKKMS